MTRKDEVRKLFLELIDRIPEDITDNEASLPVIEEVEGENTGSEVIDAVEPTQKTITPSVEENVEVVAPEVDDTDITVITSDDMLEQSIDMRLASFYEKQVELENAVKILMQEVAVLKEHFSLVEDAIDKAAKTSPTVETLASLVNQI